MIFNSKSNKGIYILFKKKTRPLFFYLTSKHKEYTILKKMHSYYNKINILQVSSALSTPVALSKMIGGT